MDAELAKSLGPKYKVEYDKPLGKGAAGTVFRAYDNLYHRACAIKEFDLRGADEARGARPKPETPEPDATLSKVNNPFMREAQLLVNLDCAHLPKVFDVVAIENKGFLVMSLIEGDNLQSRLENNKGLPLPENEVLGWTGQVIEALHCCHQAKIIHRDVKPSNIVVDQGNVAFLVDFGISYAAGMQAPLAGTRGYAPSEAFDAGAVMDARSDVYSLGATLYTLLTGTVPIDSRKRNNEPLRPARELNPEISQTTATAIDTALQLDPANRYQDVLELKAALLGLSEAQLADFFERAHGAYRSGRWLDALRHCNVVYQQQKTYKYTGERIGQRIEHTISVETLHTRIEERLDARQQIFDRRFDEAQHAYNSRNWSMALVHLSAVLEHDPTYRKGNDSAGGLYQQVRQQLPAVGHSWVSRTTRLGNNFSKGNFGLISPVDPHAKPTGMVSLKTGLAFVGWDNGELQGYSVRNGSLCFSLPLWPGAGSDISIVDLVAYEAEDKAGCFVLARRKPENELMVQGGTLLFWISATGQRPAEVDLDPPITVEIIQLASRNREVWCLPKLPRSNQLLVGTVEFDQKRYTYHTEEAQWECSMPHDLIAATGLILLVGSDGATPIKILRRTVPTVVDTFQHAIRTAEIPNDGLVIVFTTEAPEPSPANHAQRTVIKLLDPMGHLQPQRFYHRSFPGSAVAIDTTHDRLLVLDANAGAICWYGYGWLTRILPLRQLFPWI